MSASGLESEKTTTILFWVFLFGSPVLWMLSVIFEDMILPRSLQDELLFVACGICTTSQTYFYIMAAQLLYPTVLFCGRDIWNSNFLHCADFIFE